MQLRVAEALTYIYDDINVPAVILHGSAAGPNDIRVDRLVSQIEWQCDDDLKKMYSGDEAKYIAFRLPTIQQERSAYRSRLNSTRRPSSTPVMNKQQAAAKAQGRAADEENQDGGIEPVHREPWHRS